LLRLVSSLVGTIIVITTIIVLLTADVIMAAFVSSGGLFLSFPLVIIQMLCLHRYLYNFRKGEKACYFMKYLIAATSLIFVLFCILALSGMTMEAYVFLICLIPQFLVGWQIVKINTSGNDFVGGFSWLGPVMCTSAILVPLVILIPFFVGYVFVRANKYAHLYGFNTSVQL